MSDRFKAVDKIADQRRIVTYSRGNSLASEYSTWHVDLLVPRFTYLWITFDNAANYLTSRVPRAQARSK